MGKTITTLIALLVCVPFFAQEFSTKLYFETANGERDTLEIGYDPVATYGLDAVFGETEHESPISRDKFQAFIVTSLGLKYWYWDLDFLHYLKKQIVGVDYPSHVRYGAIPVIFPYESLPVTIRWDKTQFNDYCLITDLPLSFWDIGLNCTFRHLINERDSIIVEPIPWEELNPLDDIVRIFPYRKGSEHADFRLIYVTLGNYTKMQINNVPAPDISITNPVVDFCRIEKRGEEIRHIQLLSLSGEKIISLDGDVKEIDCRGLSKGVYILTVETKNNIKTQHKLIKK